MPRSSSSSSSSAAAAAPSQPEETETTKLGTVPSSVVSHTAEHNSVKSLLETVRQSVATCIDRINENKEDMDAETIARWRDRLETLIATMGTLENQDAAMDQAIRDVLMGYVDMDVEEFVEVDEAKVIDETRQTAQQRASAQPKSKKVADLLATLRPQQSASGEDDELLIQEDSGLNDARIKCPYTGQIMHEPMKNENGAKKCIHHVSLEGLRQIVRNAPARQTPAEGKCPVAGCVGRWTLATSHLDEAFKAKIDRYLKRKERETQLLAGSAASASAVAVDDDDDDV